MENTTRVGVGVMIFKEGKILLGRRQGSHGAGEYSFPGGHLEYMESFKDCIEREVAEECGVKIKNLRFQYLANVTAYAPKHYVHTGLLADWESGEPQVLEPQKCDGWEWYALDALPSPLFRMCQLAVENYRSGNTFNDAVK